MSQAAETLKGRFGQARVARLASASASGTPHLVPVVFALRDDVVVIAVDQKPKSTTDLKRIRNIRANSRVSLLADEYDDTDWSRLWWVRVDGSARVVAEGAARGSPCLAMREIPSVPGGQARGAGDLDRHHGGQRMVVHAVSPSEP